MAGGREAAEAITVPPPEIGFASLWGGRLFTLAHITDWHTTTLNGARPAAFIGKRFFGWLSWNLRRARTHRPEVLEALFADLQNQRPDHVAVTGDLTNVALESEFIEAAQWLHKLGPPASISLIPGNHDAYVRMPPHRSWDHWAPYMAGDGAAEGDPAPAFGDFPTVRVRDRVALVGLCSAVPTPLFQASGRLGSVQLARVEAVLKELRDRDVYRVVLVHHPLVDRESSRRRQLLDAAGLKEVLARCGAELVLHGHRHRTIVEAVPGPAGSIPVVGARSSSDVGMKEHKRAQYHLYRFDPENREGPITRRVRGWDPSSRSFVAEGEDQL